ncbi:BatA domain-containing protein [Planctomycetaceae bacterium SH139]
MNFLNATLLLGGLAAAIPLVLHLWGRREPRRVTFPAIRFLTQRLETHRRQIQLRRWALLALRIFLLLILALALAQPEVHRATVGQWLGITAIAALGLVIGAIAIWASVADRSLALRWGLAVVALLMLLGAGGLAVAMAASGPRPVASTTAPAAVAILIDNSPTLGYQPVGEESRLDTAGEMATWVLGRYPQQSRFALVDRSTRPATFALDAAAVQKGLNMLQPLATTRPLIERIEAAIRLLQTSELPRRTLFIFTDLSETSWEPGSEESLAGRLTALVSSEPEVSIQVVDVGSDTYRNYYLGQPELADITPAVDVPTNLTIEVKTEQLGFAAPNQQAGDQQQENSQTAPAGSLTVRLRLFDQEPGLPVQRDGETAFPQLRTVDRQTVVPRGNSPIQLDLTLPPLPLGTHHGMVELLEADPLMRDNVRFFTLQVNPPKRVLLIADDEQEREIMSRVLNPYGIDDPRREYEIELGATSMLRDTQLDSYAAVGFFNPSLPPLLIRERVDSWVRKGGHLFVAMGPNLAPNWSDQVSTSGQPMVDWPLLGNPQRVWRVPEPGTFTQVMRPGHPSLAALAADPSTPWNAFRVYHYWQLNEPDSFAELARFAGTEHLALGDRNLENGRVMVLTTPLPALVSPADNWNDLLALSLTNAWFVYVALVQEIFEDLTGGANLALNVTAGEPVAIRLEAEQSARWQLFAPDQPPAPLDANEQVLVPGIARQVGNYWLRGAQGELAGFSANLPERATRLARTDAENLDLLFGLDQYQLVRDRDEIQLAEGESSDGRPLYAMVMLVVMVLFILEQLLANRFYPGGDDSTAKASGSKLAGTSSAAA